MSLTQRTTQIIAENHVWNFPHEQYVLRAQKFKADWKEDGGRPARAICR